MLQDIYATCWNFNASTLLCHSDFYALSPKYIHSVPMFQGPLIYACFRRRNLAFIGSGLNFVASIFVRSILPYNVFACIRLSIILVWYSNVTFIRTFYLSQSFLHCPGWKLFCRPYTTGTLTFINRNFCLMEFNFGINETGHWQDVTASNC